MLNVGVLLDTQKLLLIDSAGGLLAGSLMLFFAAGLSLVDSLPLPLLFLMGGANVTYGCYSGFLRLRAGLGVSPARSYLKLLVRANAFWALLCFVLAAFYWPQASAFGRIHLIGEGVIVGSLAWLENRVFFASAPTR